jgi:hypothetical protein
MSGEVVAAFITLGGTIAIMLLAQLVTTVYFAGKLTQNVADHDRRIASLEKSDRDEVVRRARLEGKLGVEAT